MKIFTFLALCGLVTAQNRRYPYEKSDYRDVSPARPHGKVTEPRISLKLAKAISAVTTIDEFLDLVADGRNGSKNFHATDEFDGLERSLRTATRSAGCIPEFQAVRVTDELPYQPDTLYFPECVRINRCGGCCGPMLTCKPKTTTKKNVEFVVSRISWTGQIQPYELKVVPLVEHIDCECDCKVTAEDCPRKAKYFEDACECRCQNEEDEEKCEKDDEIKEWDHSTCSCHCRQEQICNPDMTFSQETCRCELDSTSERAQQEPWREYYGFSPSSGPRRRGNKDDPEY